MDDNEYDCIHGLDSRWCSLCLHPEERKEKRPTVEATFFARYEGQCRGCNLAITAGQVIHRLSNDTYVHQGCE